jgi:hypothetical protein
VRRPEMQPTEGGSVIYGGQNRGAWWEGSTYVHVEAGGECSVSCAGEEDYANIGVV